MHFHILLIGIKAEMSNCLTTSLQQQGYFVSCIARVDPLAVQQLKPDLIILNPVTSDQTDFTPCRKLSLVMKKIPVVLIGEDNSRDKITGLSTCALDYLSIPFSMEEFLARIRARLRRVCWERVENVFEFEYLRLDTLTHEVHYKEQCIELTAKEFDLLQYLITHPRQVMTHQQILNEVWPDISSTKNINILHVYIRYLRRKLLSAGKMIQTVRGVGYTLKEQQPTSHLAS